MKRSVDDLALFGGRPLFESFRPTCQLAQPDPEVFFAHARTMYQGRRLTNNGPLVRELEARLARLHEVEHCVSFCNASVGLVLLLRLLGGDTGGEVLLPTFTYPGLPHIIRWAGFTPRFCDVESTSHTMDPASAGAVITARTVAILAVHQVHSPCRIDALEELAQSNGIPLIFDSVLVLGGSWGGRPHGSFSVAEVFSLHATKLLNGFEGGYMTTKSAELATALRSSRNFGFRGKEKVGGLGLNGKLNELHAALALGSLDMLAETIADNKKRFAAYRSAFVGLPGLSVLDYAPEAGHTYSLALLEVGSGWPLTRNDTVRLLRAENALAQAHYSPPLHRSEHCPADCRNVSLPVGEELSTRFIQMPVGELVSVEDIAVLAGFLRFMADNGPAVAARLAQAGEDA